MQAFNAWQSPNILAHKWGGGGGPPWGEFNGIGTPRCTTKRHNQYAGNKVVQEEKDDDELQDLNA